MAEVYKNFGLDVTDSASAAYTCPAETTAIVIHLQAANIDGTMAADVTVTWTDASGSDEPTTLLHTVPIPAGSALNCLAGKLVLEAGDKIMAEASDANAIFLSGSVLEMD